MHCTHYCNGQLHIDQVNLREVAAQVGTPCYVYSQTAIENHWREFNDAFGSTDHTIFYAVKANSNLAVLALLADLGSGFDIVSGGELERVLKAGGNPEKVVFSGVGKSAAEIELALHHNIFSINIESEPELYRVQEIAAKTGTVAKINLRVNPDIDADTHPHITTGLKENKFGVQFAEARRLYRVAAQMPNLRIIGIAVHIGSQITSLEPFALTIGALADLVSDLHTSGIDIQHLDLGGGLGVRYRNEQPPSPAEYVDMIRQGLDELEQDVSISIEPGRAIIASAGLLLTKVEYIKTTEFKSYAVVDAAMNDLIRPALYGAWMDIIPVVESAPDRTMDVVGPVCESADFLGKDRALDVAAGDLVAVCDAGAYGAVMASNYNARPRPAEVMVKGSDFEIVRTRETFAEQIQNERIPKRLRG